MWSVPVTFGGGSWRQKAAARAVVLGTEHDALVRRGLDMAFDALVEARPSGAAVVLGLRLEQRQVATGAHERPLALFVVERARERALGARLAQHPELLGRQKLAPFVLGLDHLVDLHRGRAGSRRRRGRGRSQHGRTGNTE